MSVSPSPGEGRGSRDFPGRDLRGAPGSKWWWGVGPTRWPRSPVDVGPELRAQHVHRFHAGPVLQPHSPFAQHPPRSARPWAGPRSSGSTESTCRRCASSSRWRPPLPRAPLSGPRRAGRGRGGPPAPAAVGSGTRQSVRALRGAPPCGPGEVSSGPFSPFCGWFSHASQLPGTGTRDRRLLRAPCLAGGECKRGPACLKGGSPEGAGATT